MNTFETTATVEGSGEIRVDGPFAPGTKVKIIVNANETSAEEFIEAWERICGAMRKLPQIQNITDAEIQKDIDDFRANR